MTFNELFSKIGTRLDEIFYFLGNTPIEDLFINTGGIILAIVFSLFIVWVLILGIRIFFGLLEILIKKIFPNAGSEKRVPLEKQSMYKMGKKMKKLFLRNKNR